MLEWKWYCKPQKDAEIWDAWCAEVSAENNAEIWSSDALESLKEYKMCKDVNVKHLVKKIIVCTQCIGVPWKCDFNWRTISNIEW